LPPRAGEIADEFLKAHNVEILYNTTLDKIQNEKKDFDLVITCMGYKFKQDFMKENFPKCISPLG
jgi:hypothetical protein